MPIFYFSTPFRVAMKAFSRIMPKDGRHHKAEILPIYQKHCESLQEALPASILNDNFYKVVEDQTFQPVCL